MKLKINSAACESGSVREGILGAIFQILFIALTVWGIFWSFYRHGVGNGIVSVMIPPYAWYRGVASILEKPQWKEDYDKRTAQMAVIIENSINNDPQWQIDSKEYDEVIKDWLKHVPAAERQKLKSSANNLGIALVEYTRSYCLALLNKQTPPKPEDIPTIQMNVNNFSEIQGFKLAWGKMVEDAIATSGIVESQIQNNGALDKQAMEDNVNNVVVLLSKRVQETIDGLFNP